MPRQSETGKVSEFRPPDVDRITDKVRTLVAMKPAFGCSSGKLTKTLNRQPPSGLLLWVGTWTFQNRPHLATVGADEPVADLIGSRSSGAI